MEELLKQILAELQKLNAAVATAAVAPARPIFSGTHMRPPGNITGSMLSRIRAGKRGSPGVVAQPIPMSPGSPAPADPSKPA